MKTLFLLYHEVRREATPYLYVTTCESFRSHCERIRQLQAMPEHGFLRPELCFDDGHVSNHSEAFPVLTDMGLHARFFITAGWTGRRQGYMDWDQLRSMHRAGHTIGAHGWSHKLLTQCSASELDRELRGAREHLEAGLGVPVTTLSLPGGRASRAILESSQAAGYTHVFTSEPRAEAWPLGPTVGRVNLRSGTEVAWLDRVLTPASGLLRRLHRIHHAKAMAQAVLGDTAYHRLWSALNREEVPVDAGEALPL